MKTEIAKEVTDFFKIQDLGVFVSKGLSLAIIVGGVAVLIYLAWGAIEWLASGGDKANVQKARDKITAAIVGLIILTLTWATWKILIKFVGLEEHVLYQTTFDPSTTSHPISYNIVVKSTGGGSIEGAEVLVNGKSAGAATSSKGRAFRSFTMDDVGKQATISIVPPKEYKTPPNQVVTIEEAGGIITFTLEKK